MSQWLTRTILNSKIILFDLDGTLIKHNFGPKEISDFIISLFNIRDRNAKTKFIEFFKNNGLGLNWKTATKKLAEFLKKHYATEVDSDWLLEKLLNFNDSYSGELLLPGAKETLLLLKQNGFKLGLITNRALDRLKNAIEKQQELFEPFDYIQTFVGEIDEQTNEAIKNQVMRILPNTQIQISKFSKPRIEAFNLLNQKFLRPNNIGIKGVVFIGDARYDQIFAKTSGMKFIAVATGNLPTANWERILVNGYIIKSVHALFKILNVKINPE